MLMVRWPWGSRSMQSTRRPGSARAPPRLTAVVVLPTPPFWLAMARTRVTRGSNGCAPPSRYHTGAAASQRTRRRVPSPYHGARAGPGRGGRATGAGGGQDIGDTVSEVERVKPRAVFVEEAIQLALDSRWQEALTVNRQLVERHGPDEDTYNRLGKALSELGEHQEALDAYQHALEINPLN